MRAACLLAACLLAVPAAAEQATGSSPAVQKSSVIIKDVRFSDATQVSEADQRALAAELQGPSTQQKWLPAMSRRVIDFWQERGFFRVKVEAEPQITADSSGGQVASVNFKIIEGYQHRLKEVTWKGAKTFTPMELSALFPLKPGDIFDVAEVRRGMGIVREAYAEKSHLKAILVPEMMFNNSDHTISLFFDTQEGPEEPATRLPRVPVPPVPSSAAGTRARYVPVATYDPRRDGERDIQDALAQANETGKRVLVTMGTQACVWCHALGHFFQDHQDLLALREKNFITVAVDSSDEGRNQELLKRFPGFVGIPHLFILEKDGTLLLSQGTSVLQQSNSFSPKRMEEFLRNWAPPH